MATEPLFYVTVWTIVEDSDAQVYDTLEIRAADREAAIIQVLERRRRDVTRPGAMMRDRLARVDVYRRVPPDAVQD